MYVLILDSQFAYSCKWYDFTRYYLLCSINLRLKTESNKGTIEPAQNQNCAEIQREMKRELHASP